MKHPKTTIVAAAAGAVALGAGIGIAGFASADPTPTPTAKPSGSTAGAPDPQGGPRGRRGGGPRDDTLAADLAKKLGIDQTKVASALQNARRATRPSTPPTPGQTPPDPTTRDAELAKALASELKIDQAKVQTALGEIRAARSATEAAALKTRLDAAVKAGTLTQAEADAVTKAVAQGVIHVGPR